MGKQDVQIVISAKDLASDVLGKIGGVLAATFSVAAIAAFGKAAVDSASEQEQAEIKLAQALGRTSQGLLDQAAALQKTTRFADEQIIAAQAGLAMFTKDEAQIKQLTKATLDFAAAKGMDLASAADIVGKSLGSEVSMLGRYGVATEGAAGSTERFSSIMQGLGSHFGGQAEAQATSFSGTVTKLKHSFDEVLESIGNTIVKSPVVIAAIKGLNDVFADLGGWIQKNQIWLLGLVKDGVVNLVRGIASAISVVQLFHTSWEMLKVIAHGALVVISGALWGIWEAARFVLMPFDLLMQGLVKLGAIESNPFDALSQGLKDFTMSAIEGTDAAIEHSAQINVGYEGAIQKALAFADTLEGIKAVSTEVKDSIVANATETGDAVVAQDKRMTDSSWYAGVQRIQMNDLMTRADQMAGNIRNAAYKSMETQLMRMVELHRFSAAEFGKAVMQSVKSELIGIAARATVWALFETAMGLATMFTNPAESGSHFAAAGEFAAIAGATVAAAAAVNVLSGPGAQTGGSTAPGSSPSNPTYTSETPSPSVNQAGTTNVTHVTVNVHNPLSTQNWDEIMELDVAPAILRAQQRGAMA